MITYNTQQLEEIANITEWILSPALATERSNLYLLKGYAGTGKTTIVKEILDRISGIKVVVSAPTHQAKKVIAKKINKPGETIQKILGLRPNVELDDFDPNRPVFDPRAEPSISDYGLVIIDEASMINRFSFDLIVKLAIDYNTKVLFIGDDAQLPPVKESLSKVFKLENVSSLTIIERQKNGNPNNVIIDLAREDVINETDLLVPYLLKNKKQYNEKGEGYELLNKVDFFKHALTRYFNSEFQVNTDFVKTVTWSNDTVNSINNYFRRNLYPNAKELLTVGDLLKGYRSMTKELPGPPYFLPLIENSVEYLVHKVEIITKFILKIKLKVYQTTLNNGITIDILHPDSYNDYIFEIEQRKVKAQATRNWKQYYAFHDKVILITNSYNLAGQLVTSKHIDYGYGSTVHKTQGSTYKHVYTTIGELVKNKRDRERRSLLYVALSRCEETNIMQYG